MRYLTPIYKFFDSRPFYLYLSVFFMFGLLRLGMLQWDPIGLPDDHDEFSFLLQAEIFANGKMAMPAHPLWQHFESFHILVNPVYASKYPPGQAFFLFLGIKMFGHAWYGVLLSCMIMTVALVYMIRGYCNIQWTLIAALFIIIRFAMWNYWSSSYWGGAVAAMGGAMIFGALPRFVTQRKLQVVQASICFGLGLALLSQSRPFEGLVVAILPGLFFLHQIYKLALSKKMKSAMVLLFPALAVLFLNFAITAAYNYQLTGDPLKMPYSLHADQYSVQSPFLFIEQKSPPVYNHDLLRRQYIEWEVEEINSVKDYLKLKRWHFNKFIRFFHFWPLLLALCFLFIDRKGIEIPYWSFLLFCFHILFTTWFHPHYFAPALAIYYLLLIYSVRYLLGHRFPLIKSTAKIVIPLFLVVTLVNARYFATRHSGYINGSQPYIKDKQQVIDQLTSTKEDHVVLVDYSEAHPLHHEWVYNEANLDEAKVLWARFKSDDKTDELLTYFNNRKIWYLRADETPVRLLEYKNSNE